MNQACDLLMRSCVHEVCGKHSATCEVFLKAFSMDLMILPYPEAWDETEALLTIGFSMGNVRRSIHYRIEKGWRQRLGDISDPHRQEVVTMRLLRRFVIRGMRLHATYALNHVPELFDNHHGHEVDVSYAMVANKSDAGEGKGE